MGRLTGLAGRHPSSGDPQLRPATSAEPTSTQSTAGRSGSGNGSSAWGAAHDNLVEGCRIWQVYDAALTNQGRSPDSRQVNITYRNNFIRNAEYSFEYWNHLETALTENIRFGEQHVRRRWRGLVARPASRTGTAAT